MKTKTNFALHAEIQQILATRCTIPADKTEWVPVEEFDALEESAQCFSKELAIERKRVSGALQILEPLFDKPRVRSYGIDRITVTIKELERLRLALTEGKEATK